MIYRNLVDLFLTMDLEGEMKARVGKKWKTRWCHLTRDTHPAGLVATITKVGEPDQRKVSSAGPGQTTPRSASGQETISLSPYCGYHAASRLNKEDNVLAIISRNRLLMLALPSERELKRWEDFLRNTMGEDTCFNLFIVEQPKASKIKNGFAKLYVRGSSLVLVALSSPQLGLVHVTSWQIQDVTRVSLAEDNGQKLRIEGKFAGGEVSGEGCFSFQSSDAEKLCKVLDEKTQGHGTSSAEPSRSLCGTQGGSGSPLNFYQSQYLPQMLRHSTSVGAPATTFSAATTGMRKPPSSPALAAKADHTTLAQASNITGSTPRNQMRFLTSSPAASSSTADRVGSGHGSKGANNYDVPPIRYKVTANSDNNQLKTPSSSSGTPSPSYDVPPTRRSLEKIASAGSSDSNNNPGSNCLCDSRLGSLPRGGTLPKGRRSLVGMDGKRIASADPLLLSCESINGGVSCGFAGGSEQSGTPLPMGKRSLVGTDGTRVYRTVEIPPYGTDFPVTQADYNKQLKYVDLSSFDGPAHRSKPHDTTKNPSDHVYDVPRPVKTSQPQRKDEVTYANVPGNPTYENIANVHRSVSLDTGTVAQMAAQSGYIDRHNYLVPYHSPARPVTGPPVSAGVKDDKTGSSQVMSPTKAKTRDGATAGSNGGSEEGARRKSKVRASLSLFGRKSSSTPAEPTPPSAPTDHNYVDMIVGSNALLAAKAGIAPGSSATHSGATTSHNGHSSVGPPAGPQECHYMAMDLKAAGGSFSSSTGRSGSGRPVSQRSSTSQQSSSVRSSVLNSSDLSLTSSSDISLHGGDTTLTAGANRSAPASPVPPDARLTVDTGAAEAPSAAVIPRHTRTRSEPVSMHTPIPTTSPLSKGRLAPIDARKPECTYMNLSSTLRTDDAVNYAEIILVNRPPADGAAPRSQGGGVGRPSHTVAPAKSSDDIVEYAEINHMATAAAHQLAQYRLHQSTAANESFVEAS